MSYKDKVQQISAYELTNPLASLRSALPDSIWVISTDYCESMMPVTHQEVDREEKIRLQVINTIGDASQNGLFD